jgi:vancomycin aglycone glucosyltransferase
MKVVLAPFGSRGDVEPMLALGRALTARGHDVVVCAPADFGESAQAASLSFVSAGAPFRGIFDGSQSDTHVFLASLAQAEAQYEALLPVCVDADVIVGAALQFAAPTVAEVLGIRYRYAVFSPMSLRSVELPPFGGAALPLEASVARWSWAHEDKEGLLHADWLQRKRLEHRLAPLTSLHLNLLGSAPVLGAFDPIFCPLPSDALPAVVTGHWRLQQQVPLPQGVTEFIEAGAAPLYVGFGSMSHLDSATLFQLIVSEALSVGTRVLIGRGWAEFDETLLAALPNCMTVHDISHDALFPHLSAVVHHGGAGTTMAAARSGVPQLIVPHLGDQFYHASRVRRLGLGPEPVVLRELSRETMRAPLRELLSSEGLRSAAAAMAQGLREREGSASAAEILEPSWQR